MHLKKILSAILALTLNFSVGVCADANNQNADKRQMEALQRGIVARDAEDKGIFISWRNLACENVKYNVYRNGILLNSSPLDKSNFTDEYGTANDTYFVTSIDENGIESERSEGATPFTEFLSIPLQRPEPQKNKWNRFAEYSAQKAGVGDLDGDGEYELVVVWYPDNAQDNSQSGHTSPVFIDAYELNGTHLWRINMGPNIRAGEHYVPTLVYDFDGDGKAEIALRTADGTIDGSGTVIGDADRLWADERGYILSGPEYLTVFEGTTGKAIDTIDFSPERGSVADWGDTGGNRVDRFLGGVAYLNGKTPCLIMSRGYYTNREGTVGKTGITAYSLNNGKINIVWEFNASLQDNINPDYVGQGNHSMVTADVDNDGCDEIIYGSMVVDHNGKGLYSTKRGHGDAIHVGYFKNLDRMQIVKANESEDIVKSGYGFEYRYADSDEMIFSVAGTKDNGRTIVADIDPTADGPVIYGAGGTGMWLNTSGDTWERLDSSGATIAFPIWWTGDLLRELGEGIYAKEPTGYKVVKYDWENKRFNQLFFVDNVISSRRPLLQCDILGDWREELMLAEEDGLRIRLYTTNIPTEYNLTTLMHDPKYRLDIATQPSGYSQPPWTGYYIGHDNFTIPAKGDFTYNKIPSPAIDDNYFVGGMYVSMTLNIGSEIAVLNGKKIKIDENSLIVPFSESNTAFVPLRFVGENLGFDVQFNDLTQEITLIKADKTIKLQINSTSCFINDTEYRLDDKIQIYNNRTFVSIRIITDIFGANVDYNNNTVNISI